MKPLTKPSTKILWLLLALVVGAVVWLLFFSAVFFPLAIWIPSSDRTLISLGLLALLLGLPAFLSAVASVLLWRKYFCRFGKWVGVLPPLTLTFVLLLGFSGFSLWEAISAILISFLLGLIAASYTDRVCSIRSKEKS
jgi:hypothetical protein